MPPELECDNTDDSVITTNETQVLQFIKNYGFLQITGFTMATKAAPQIVGVLSQ